MCGSRTPAERQRRTRIGQLLRAVRVRARVLYDRPDNAFVAEFIGSPAMNLCTCSRGTNGTVSLGGADVPVSRAAGQAAMDAGIPDVVVGIRPEALLFHPVSGERLG